MLGLLIAAALPLRAADQQSTGGIVGHIVDAAAAQNLAGARIRVLSTGQEAVTDRAGRFRIADVPSGRQTVSVSYLGYEEMQREVSVPAGGVAELSLALGEEIVELEAVTVSGERAGRARALNLQRASGRYVNIVSADAIGQFPDQNAAEALQRLPGVSIERDQGEGRYVVLRGIDPDLNSISVDGMMLAAPEADTRKVALDVIPTDLVDGLEVSKTITPDLDGDAIGGNVNIRTKSPFDRDGRLITAAGQVQYNGLVDAFSEKIWGSYGDRFGRNREFGLTLSASWQDRRLGSDNVEVDGAWTSEEDPDGHTAYFAPEIEFREYVIDRERYGAGATLEYRPDEQTHLAIRAMYSYFSDQEYRYRTEVKFERGDIVALGDGTATVENADKTDRDIKDRFEEQTIYTLSLDGEHSFDAWDLDYALGFSRGEENEPDRLDSDFRHEGEAGVRYDFTKDRSRPVVTQFGGDDLFDPALFAFDEAVVENNLSREKEWSAKVNARYTFTLREQPSYLKMGLKMRRKDKENDGRADIYEWAGAEAYTLADVAEYSPRYDFFPGPDGRYLRADAAAVRRFFRDNLASFERDDEGSAIDSAAGDYESREDISAAYVMLGTKLHQTVDVTTGVRYERTDFSTAGNEIVYDENGDLEAIRPVQAERDYQNLLPSISLRYEPIRDLVVRASWSQTIARPKFGDSAYRREVNREDQEVIEGNPLLDPYEATNLDLSADYYFGRLGVFSAAVFYKDIDNFVYRQKIENGDTSTGYDLLTPLNGESAQIRGLELAWQQDLDFLPAPFDGFSIYTNLTWTSSSSSTATRPGEDIPFLKQSARLGTIAVAYERGPFFARVAGTFRDDYLDEIGADALEDIYVDDHFQVDLSLRWRLSDSAHVFAEVINLNNAPLRRYYGVSGGMSQFEEYAWSSNVGVKLNF